jgi:hypothetical protein
MSKKRVHILSAVNAANVSKSGGYYLIKGVCGAVDDIVMNSVLYPAEQLAAGVKSLEGKPAPAGHPKNSAGQAISALNGEALASAWIGSYCVNARHEGGRSLVDIKVNEKQARAHEQGELLCNRLDAAIDGTNADPVHVSTGLFFQPIATNGEAGGKKYSRIATNLEYDHLAILLNERGAGSPEDGVGMFLNEDGQAEEVEEFTLNAEPADRRVQLPKWLASMTPEWIKGLICNGADVSFDQITSGLYAHMTEGCWIQEVFDRYAVWRNRDGKLYRQDYSVASDGSVSFTGTAQEVTRKVSYQPINNREDDQVFKETIIAALNAAGISGAAAMTDAQLLDAYNALKAQPHLDALNKANEKLTAANSKIAEHEAAAKAAETAERDALATKLATNSSLTADDFKAMPLARLKELDAKAAPVVVGNSGGGAKESEFKGYNPNALIDEGSK